MTAHPVAGPESASEPEPETRSRRIADIPLRSAARLPAIASLLIAAVAHIPVTGPHLEEAPYIGVLFIALTIACVALAVALAAFDTPTMWDLTILVSGLALLAFVLSRTVGLPQITDDIGNWSEPLGPISIASESVAVVCGVAAHLAHRFRQPR